MPEIPLKRIAAPAAGEVILQTGGKIFTIVAELPAEFTALQTAGIQYAYMDGLLWQIRGIRGNHIDGWRIKRDGTVGQIYAGYYAGGKPGVYSVKLTYEDSDL